MELKVPVLPESVADATVSKWYKKPGDPIRRDENIVDLETDKVMLEVPALVDGVLEAIRKPEGATVTADEVLGVIKEGAKSKTKPAKKTKAVKAEMTAPELSPSVRRFAMEHNIDIAEVQGTGKGGRITKTDLEGHLAAEKAPTTAPAVTAGGTRVEKRVPMSRLRARVAERLVEVQQTTAMLTTFNEVNMHQIMKLRTSHKESFEKAHGVPLGLISFFVKAAVEALKRFPGVNASLDGSDMVYHGYVDIGIAVSTDRGLVVPVLRDVEQMDLAEIEVAIRGYAEKARNNKLSIEDIIGGTFTITNGGVFGSMLSTPIINAPQSAILGMHNIIKRPVVEDDQVVIRPMMYLALSYDHRTIDGRDSVSFLRTIKELLEDPACFMLDI